MLHYGLLITSVVQDSVNKGEAVFTEITVFISINAPGVMHFSKGGDYYR